MIWGHGFESLIAFKVPFQPPAGTGALNLEGSHSVRKTYCSSWRSDVELASLRQNDRRLCETGSGIRLKSLLARVRVENSIPLLTWSKSLWQFDSNPDHKNSESHSKLEVSNRWLSVGDAHMKPEMFLPRWVTKLTPLTFPWGISTSGPTMFSSKSELPVLSSRVTTQLTTRQMQSRTTNSIWSSFFVES